MVVKKNVTYYSIFYDHFNYMYFARVEALIPTLTISEIIPPIDINSQGLSAR